jgi:hypothetical protein
LNVFVERIANLTDWEKVIITYHRYNITNETVEAFKCNKIDTQFHIARLTPKLNSIRASDIKEVQVELCQGKTTKQM